MEIAVFSILILGILGLIFGICLGIAATVFHVKVDQRIEEVDSKLPHLNCGACGYAGCIKYAEAIVKNNEVVTLCGPGGRETAERIAAIMGVTLELSRVKEVAFVFCCGGKEAKKLVDYQGIPDCNAAITAGGGPLGCDYGCMMYYSCFHACKFNAIRIDEEGLPVIIPENCTACRACVKACPKKIIRMVPKKSLVFIICNSKDRAKDVTEVCSRGCIGCTKCVKVCPVQAIHMEEGLAVIDHNICNNCKDCIPVCPVSVIHERRSQVSEELLCQHK